MPGIVLNVQSVISQDEVPGIHGMYLYNNLCKIERTETRMTMWTCGISLSTRQTST